MSFSWMNSRRQLALSATIGVLVGANSAMAQVAQFGNPYQNFHVQQQPAVEQYQQHSATPGQQHAAGQQAAGTHYPQTPYLQTTPSYSYQPAQPGPSQSQQPQYQYGQQQGTPYVASAMTLQSPQARTASQTLNAPQETVPPGNSQHNSHQEHQYYVPNGSYSHGYESYSAGGGYGGCYGYNTYASSPGYGYGGYGHAGHHHGKHCATGSCSLDGCYDNCAPRRQWFGGVYGLLMERVNCGCRPLAFETMDRTPTDHYYPNDGEVAIWSGDLDIDFQGGAEVRLGSTFLWGMDPCNPCNPRWAWEVAYWGLVEDSRTRSLYDDMPLTGDRIGSMLRYNGLEADFGGGFRPMNDYFANWDGGDLGISELHYRSTFTAQNLEFNLLRLPSLVSCSPCGGKPRYQVTTLAGIRFMRFDEGFLSYTGFEWSDGGTPPMSTGDDYLAYNLDVTNKLVGFQLGANGIYHLGQAGKWSVYCNSTAGIFDNRITLRRWADGGMVQYANWDQEDLNARYSKNNVAFVGEARVGLSYQWNCHCRLTAGWRALGVTGVGLALDQHVDTYYTPGQSGIVDCNGSIFLHGLQTGVEWTY